MSISLVTGGAGFIGSHVTDQLISSSHTVVVLDDLSGGFLGNVSSQAIFIKGSILDNELIETLFKQYQFDYVYHFAAYAAEGMSHFVRSFNYQNNLIGSINLINAAVNHQVKCFVFASSIAVYGKNSLPMREDAVPNPLDPYGIAKYAIELDLKAAHKQFGLNYIIFRPHNVYGKRQNIADPYRNVIGIFIKQILQNKPLTIFGDGHQTRAFSYIDDIATQLAQAGFLEKAYNQIFNIGGDHPYAINDIAEKIKLAFSLSDYPISYLPERNEVFHAHADHHKIRTFFHSQDQSQTSLDIGLTKMIAWAKKQTLVDSTFTEPIEISKNLPDIWKKHE